jgi:uncharacterized protein
VPQQADTLDLKTLDLRPGEGRRFDIEVRVAPMSAGGQRYAVEDGKAVARVDISRTTTGFAFRLRVGASLSGPCTRCLSEAHPVTEVDTREVEEPAVSAELRSPYFEDGELKLASWVRDALVLALPARLLCRDDCRGLCAVCGADLNEADPEDHRHEEAADPRWAKLRELRLE